MLSTTEHPQDRRSEVCEVLLPPIALELLAYHSLSSTDSARQGLKIDSSFEMEENMEI